MTIIQPLIQNKQKLVTLFQLIVVFLTLQSLYQEILIIIELSFLPTSILLLFIVFAYLVYLRVIKPYRQYRLYKQIVTSNYKAYVYPFTITPIAMMNQKNKDYQKYGDSQYTVKNVHRQYQIVMRMLQSQVYLNLVDPQLIRQFYERTSQWCYIKSTKGFFVIPFGQVLGKGLALSEGLQWKNKRKVMSTVFNYDFIKSKIKTISNITKDVLDKIETTQKGANDNLNAKSYQVKFNVNNALQEIFGTTVVKCFFGDVELVDIKNQPIFNFFNDLMELTVQRSKSALALIFGPKFFEYSLRPIDRKLNKMNKQFNSYVSNIIKDQIRVLKSNKSQSGNNECQKINGLIQMLVKSNKLKTEQEQMENNENKQKDYYTIQELIDEFKTFFFAGTDTTSNNLTVLFYTLTKHKQILQKLRKEIDEVIGSDLDLTYEKLKNLKYMQKVQKEALRMAGPSTGIFKREAVKDHYIGNIPIKKGVIVTINMDSNHFKHEFYKNPEIFNPDRWDDIDSSKSDPFSFYPFSYGLRNCIGQHLAMIEAKIALIHLLKRYKDIKLQKPDFRMYLRTIYGPENFQTTFKK